MRAACEHAGVALVTAYPVRFHPGVPRAARARAARRPRAACWPSPGPTTGRPPSRRAEWFVDPELAGGAPSWTTPCTSPTCSTTCSTTSPARVYAQVNRIVHAHEVEVETGGLVALDLPGRGRRDDRLQLERPRELPRLGRA